MTEAAVESRGKKSVALSGVPAGNTALSSVGRTGNDLHYRGYDIKDLATHCEFEEVAYLLIHGKLPNQSELSAYKTKLHRMRELPAAVKAVLEQLPAASHGEVQFPQRLSHRRAKRRHRRRRRLRHN